MNSFWTKLTEFARHCLSTFDDNLFVDNHNCLLCEAELAVHAPHGLCPSCASKLQYVGDNICNKCGRTQRNEAEYCITCQNYARSFDFARSSCVYEGIAKQLVRGLKFGNKKYYGRYMANVMAETYLNNDFDCDIILAVPLSKSRLVRRGYNQSFVLAQHLSKLLKLPLDTKSLIKIKDTPEQARKSGKQRELNVLGAYAVVNKTAICGRKVLIVDDVLTTGATTSEVAKMLYKAKARQAQVLTFASTQFKINADKLTAEIAQQSYAEID